MPNQTAYTERQPIAVQGALGDMTPRSLRSGTVEGTTPIAFGVAIERGTAADQVKAFDGGVILGVTVRDRSIAGAASNAVDAYAQYESVRYIGNGSIGNVWVTTAVACNPGNPVYVRPSNNTFQMDNTNSAIQIPGASYQRVSGIGGLNLIQFDNSPV